MSRNESTKVHRVGAKEPHCVKRSGVMKENIALPKHNVLGAMSPAAVHISISNVVIDRFIFHAVSFASLMGLHRSYFVFVNSTLHF